MVVQLTRLALAGVLVSFLSACASVPMASPEQDAAAKEFRPPPADRAHLYVYRNESIGSAVKQPVVVDGIAVGQTAAKVFFLIPLAPGAHTVTSLAENTFDLPISVAGGKSYFVWQEVKFGLLQARTKLHLVDEEKGKEGVLECKLGQPTALPPVPPAPAAAPAVPRT